MNSKIPRKWVWIGSLLLLAVLLALPFLVKNYRVFQFNLVIVYAVAMGFHFVVNDQGLREDHGAAYDKRGRWILATAPLAGWAVGVLVTLPPLLVSSLFGFLMGGVVLNVLKEELPDERESRFWAFALGAIVYAAVLLFTR